MQHTAQKYHPPQTAGFAHPHTNVSVFGLEHGMHVVDFGSGSGHYVIAIAEWLAGSGHVYAVDVQRDLLKRTQNEAHKKGLNNVSVIWNDLERSGSSKMAAHTADVVLISNTLFQLVDKSNVLIEAHRILKAAGKLIIIDWTDSYKGLGPARDDVVKKEAAIQLAQQCGFEMLREFVAGAHHYGLIFRPLHKAHK